MNMLSKFASKFNMRDRDQDDDYFYDDDNYDEDDYDDSDDGVEEEKPQHPFLSKLGGQQQGSSRQQRSGGFLGRKVVPIDGGRSSEMEVTVIKPASMEDTRDVCDYLLAGKAVVLNMEGINADLAQRVIDFTLGAIYAIDGDLQPVSKYIYIASPHNVELSGDFEGDFMNLGKSKGSIASLGFDTGRRYGG